MKDFYKILEVSPGASQAVIEAAYNTLIEQRHLGRDSGELEITDFHEAFEVLSSPIRRRKYDTERGDLLGKVIQGTSGAYRVIERISAGKFWHTYRGEHILLGKSVCIKHAMFVSAVFEEKLLREARVIWDIRHYSIPVARDIIRLEDGSLALVMSYIEGKTLATIIREHGSLDSEHVAWIAERVLNVLNYLHDEGVVHGDVQPANVIVQASSHRLVLVDYGLALVKPTEKSGVDGFTPLFASPEAKGGGPLLPESDYFSLGMMMIYALLGEKIFLIDQKIPANVPSALREFIERLIVSELHLRPDREKEDLFETIQKVRKQVFGRRRSEMKLLLV
ncbi:MAG: protein kinase [Parcubacteria group bacterium]|nr:protein kinase [Parcubacteria group bacterium]